MLLRERSLAPAGLLLPAPAPLPSLRNALQRRAALFGPVDLHEAPMPPRGTWQALGDMARRIVETLDPRQSAWRSRW